MPEDDLNLSKKRKKRTENVLLFLFQNCVLFKQLIYKEPEKCYNGQNKYRKTTDYYYQVIFEVKECWKI